MDSRVQACVGVILQTNGAKTLARQMLGLKLHKVYLKGQWPFFSLYEKSSFPNPGGWSGLWAIHLMGKQEQRQGKESITSQSVHDLCFVKLS